MLARGELAVHGPAFAFAKLPTDMQPNTVKTSLVPPSSSSSSSCAARELSALRSQTACVRALLDEIERVVPHSHLDDDEAASSLRAQLIEELSRLGTIALEASAQLVGASHEAV